MVAFAGLLEGGMGSRFDDFPNLRLGAIAGVGPAGRRTGKAERAAKYRRQRGTFLLPRRLCLPVTRTMAVRLPAAALGGAWTPGKPRRWDGKESLEKTLCADSNSIIGIGAIGIGAMRSNRTNRV